jgi:hypothetical protein
VSRYFYAAAIGSFFVILSSCAPSLSGRLVTRNGDAIISSDAAVNVTPLDKKSEAGAPAIVPVSADGEFKAELKPGIYLVESFVPDFSVASQRIEIGKSPVSLRLILEKLPATKPRPVGANMDIDAARGAGGAVLTPPQL